ncbi:hypothetical protein RND71_003510 [Anisodus tanguticus]|uniref:U1-type domain-containing protein n=1 Tax=Anisodus tanguticus TaxID=243964 RepID=A0AAE1VWQ3_9SOLA|nr:hypothetical protein RND71_003510 [Anisodus tanguticus]
MVKEKEIGIALREKTKGERTYMVTELSLIKPMEYPSLKNETFLAVAEGYLEENGSDALEKLIANKDDHHAEEIKPTDTSDEAGMLTPNQVIVTTLCSYQFSQVKHQGIVCEEDGPVWESIKVTEHMGKHEAAEPKQVKFLKENPIQIEKKTTGVQVKEMVVPADAEEIKLPEITSSKQVQTEWTCLVCQLTTTSEQNLKSHLNGRRHKEKCEELKTWKKMAKSEGSSPVTTKSNQLNQVKHVAAARSEHSAKKAAEPKQIIIF